MEYALLLYAPATDGFSAEERAVEHPRWVAYTQELVDAGVHRAGRALQWLDTATTVRERGGDRLLTDGPFAETKEVLAGFYLIDVPDLDAAMEWAAKIPLVGRGSVEVRPTVEYDPPA